MNLGLMTGGRRQVRSGGWAVSSHQEGKLWRNTLRREGRAGVWVDSRAARLSRVFHKDLAVFGRLQS